MIIAQNLYFYDVVWHTLMILVQFHMQWNCLFILDCPFDSNVYVDCPSNSFACVMILEYGPHLHVLKCRNNLLQAFECIKELAF